MTRTAGQPLPERDANKRERILGHFARRHRRRLRKRRAVFALLGWVR
jgi:hypothetical protein